MPDWDYPDLPVSRRREEILDAMRSSRVVVVVGETGSGKTTQLPKMALELARERGEVILGQVPVVSGAPSPGALLPPAWQGGLRKRCTLRRAAWWAIRCASLRR